ncbi:hypothetical protein [Arthrobacter sp. KBS0702]|uniref:hypothetical protein n=1 Tax=Arthrobacter sp. KBS0702 TaxID=2578107 RepID=UPI0021BDA573|nr:hypothetical protein [Arthrobacter sp. KBS0702]
MDSGRNDTAAWSPAETRAEIVSSTRGALSTVPSASRTLTEAPSTPRTVHGSTFERPMNLATNAVAGRL